MAEHQQQSSSTNESVGTGSVVNDLMRVYENLTQSSTPQAGVLDASKSLSIAYNNNINISNGVNHINAISNTNSSINGINGTSQPVYQPPLPVGYPIPHPAYQPLYEQQQQQQQQQQTISTTATTLPNNPLHTASQPPPQIFRSSYNNSNQEGVVVGSKTTSYPQQQLQQMGNPGYVPVPMGTTPPIGPPANIDKDAGNHPSSQRAREELHHGNHNIRGDGSSSYSQAGIVRNSSTISNQQGAGDGASSESEKSTSGGRSRRKRKQLQQQDGVNNNNGSSVGKKGNRNKKSKKEDGRWSKRFTWPEDLHRDFVSAIFDVGLKHASPSSIMEHMPKHEQITTERIKSHLQKYRLHRVKSKKEFISSYEASLRNFQQNQNNGNGTSLVAGNGEVAAHVTSAVMGTSKSGSPETASKEDAGNSSNASSLALVQSGDKQQQLKLAQTIRSDDGNDSLMLPQLTEEEKKSPIGAAMGYLMGLFFSLKQQLLIQRSLEEAGEKAKGNTLFSSSSAAIAAATSNVPPTAAAVTAAAVASSVEFSVDGTMQQSQQSQPPAIMRTNIEENSIMKREMQNQMALQNKMRALKQQELAKYKDINKGATPDAVLTTEASHGSSTDHHLSETGGGIDNSNNVEGDYAVGVVEQQHHQISGSNDAAAATQGEMAGTDMPSGTTAVHDNNNNNLLGIDHSDDFWHTDVSDNQLFEFLMDS
uniref:HTH myb-type domain-containing protein n=1 Tax=Pseudo-nitzschia australis TaxID=44445 RepID=A0A6V0AEB9_9STRA|mmetsp:Transcript_3394/g.7403  ORF Transcript_3394/g.7403 Transcript_3394/m.7403 type:complete len:705 (-) Transcript_3394:1241-3355(-)